MKKLLLLSGFIFHLSFVLFAQTMGLEEVRTLAFANSRSLAKYNLTVTSTLLDERSRIFSALPSLSLGANASMSLWNTQNTAPVRNPLNTLNSSMNVGISQKIFEGGKTLVQKAINEITSESARKDALSEYFNVLDSADNSYYAVLEAMAVLEAEESSLQTAIVSLSIAEVRRTTGMINQGDYLKALADKETRENYRNQAKRNLTLSVMKLKVLTGLSVIPELQQIDFCVFEELISCLVNISDDEADSLYAELWKTIASVNSSFVKASLANQRAEKNLSMTQLSYSPSLSASVSSGLNYSPNNGMEMSGGKLSLNLSIPVDYWVMVNNVKKSRIARDSAALDYISAEVNLETELQSALLNVFTYAGSVLNTGLIVEYSEKHFEYVMERYRLSQSSINDLNEASTLLINSRNNLIKAHYGFLQSLSKLRSLGAFSDEEKLLTILNGGS
ncbi:MAG: TolC family protein [Treponema sp.]|jgi:outer membrane protein TolC|nr:TolC family protein [Treponema sp.]